MMNLEGTGRAGNSGSVAGEDTLRLIAKATPPDGLEDRVKARLRLAIESAPGVLRPVGRILAWRETGLRARRESGLDSEFDSGIETGLDFGLKLGTGALLRPRGWMRNAAAAAIVCVVAAGCWSVYSRVQPGHAARVVGAPHGAMSGSGEFSNAKAMRTPQTLNGPVVQSATAVPAADKTIAAAPVDAAKKNRAHAPAAVPAGNASADPADSSGAK